ncbi:hypothetical protein DF032_03385 [Burkholderia seminalis]|nr:hypothetical protein DF032_03385 [Burkholderia seminalis]
MASRTISIDNPIHPLRTSARWRTCLETARLGSQARKSGANRQ